MTDQDQKVNPDQDELKDTNPASPDEEVKEEPSDPKEENATGENNDEVSSENGQSPESEELKKVKDQLLRTMAEFDNYRKRTTREKEQTFERGEKYVVEVMLPVIDNFERALGSCKDPEDSFVKGVQMIHDQMLGVLEKLGVTQLDDVGKTFDPHFHDAMQHVDDEAYGESEIVQVFRKGYQMNDTVIRPSLVKVAN